MHVMQRTTSAPKYTSWLEIIDNQLESNNIAVKVPV